MRKALMFLMVVAVAAAVYAQQDTPKPAEPGKENEPAEKKTSKWLFIYWMPYDNNLAHCGPPIVEMMAQGVKSPDVNVVVQADFTGKGGMKRYVITKRGTRESALEDEEESASEKVYGEYLDWVHENFKADKYVIVFLNHGGTLDRLCLDEHPKRRFFQAGKLCEKIRQFNKKTGKKLELLYLQVCAKASVEPLYEFRKTAKYTLASEFPIGAPNYYYTAVLKSIGENPDIDGDELARKIVQHDRLSMYVCYTCIDNARFGEFVKLLDAFVESVKDVKEFTLSVRKVRCHAYANEPYFDFVSFLTNLSVSRRDRREKLHPLMSFIKCRLIRFFITNPERELAGFSGLSLAMPPVKEQYRYMGIYKDSKLLSLVEKVKVTRE